ncbi:hypothetical protein ACFYZ8_21280 [Streptomyces sp. NPDC001668]|uniref:hypothetical protein n=1 Tax=unclassified Streptomyces TaxID=2593676 RepID=UPI00367620AF
MFGTPGRASIHVPICPDCGAPKYDDASLSLVTPSEMQHVEECVRVILGLA